MKIEFAFIINLLIATSLQAQVSSSTMPEIPNAGLEKWTNIVNSNWQVPDGWTTNATDLLHTVEKETPGYIGNGAMRVNYGGYAETGFATTVHPGSVGMYVHTGYRLADTVKIEVMIYKNGLLVDGGYWSNNHTSPIAGWTSVAVPLSLNSSTADSVLVRVIGGHFPGTYISVDGVSFAPPTTGVNEASLITGWRLFPNPASGSVELRYVLPRTMNLTLQLYGADGQVVRTFKQNELLLEGSYTDQLDLHGLSRGNYQLGFYNGTERKSFPLVIK